MYGVVQQVYGLVCSDDVVVLNDEMGRSFLRIIICHLFGFTSNVNRSKLLAVREDTDGQTLPSATKGQKLSSCFVVDNNKYLSPQFSVEVTGDNP